MGQAAIDLPNPNAKTVSKSPAPAGADSSADDLLSKLAGDEIDRMLAGSEADEGTADAETFDSADLDPADAALKVPGVQEEMDAILGSMEPSVDAAAMAQESGDVMQSQLDVLFNELSSEIKPEARADVTSEVTELHFPAIDTATTDVPAPGPTNASNLEASYPAEAVGDAQSTAERAALAAPIAQHDEQEYVDAPLPLYLKPLEILNSPFASMPEWFTETLGKIGIMTSINAIAVIIYVVVFRRPSH